MGMFSDAQDYVLYNYYLMAMQDIRGGTASQEEICRVIQGPYSAPIIRKAIEQLQSDSKLTKNEFASFPETDKIEITRYGLNNVDENLESFGGNFIKRVSDGEDDYIQRLEDGFAPHAESKNFGFAPDNAGFDQAPFSDAPGSSWEPIPLDREDPKLDAAIESLNSARDAIAADNGYAATEPDERAAVLEALNAGSEALKSQSQIYYFQFKAFVWEPLLKVIDRFGQNAVGIAAASARDAVKEVFKELIKGLF